MGFSDMSEWGEDAEREMSRAEVLAEMGVYGLLLDVRAALEAATTIGMRSCSPGDSLNYGNHDRLIRRIDAALERKEAEGE
jgi:hypothetical protein